MSDQGPSMTEAERLVRSGYRQTSSRFRLASRIDRPDWKEHMASKHAPWCAEEGMRWVELLGASAADHYRRVYSRDQIEVTEFDLKRMREWAQKVPDVYYDVIPRSPKFEGAGEPLKLSVSPGKS